MQFHLFIHKEPNYFNQQNSNGVSNKKNIYSISNHIFKNIVGLQRGVKEIYNFFKFSNHIIYKCISFYFQNEWFNFILKRLESTKFWI